jgi:hypothetical protein
MRVSSYTTFEWDEQTVYSGYYRNTGWMPNIYSLTDITTANPDTGNTTLIQSLQMPATGTTTIPDEQQHIAPRALSWDETKIKFLNGADLVAEFFWKDIISWSNKAPA